MRLAAIPLVRWFWGDAPQPVLPEPVPEALECEPEHAADRRVGERYPCHREAWLHQVSIVKTSAWHAIVMDISEGGMGLAIERPVMVGTFFAIELPDPLTATHKTIRARVVHSTRRAHNYYHIGCAFMTPLTGEEIESLLL